MNSVVNPNFVYLNRVYFVFLPMQNPNFISIAANFEHIFITFQIVFEKCMVRSFFTAIYAWINVLLFFWVEMSKERVSTFHECHIDQRAHTKERNVHRNVTPTEAPKQTSISVSLSKH